MHDVTENTEPYRPRSMPRGPDFLPYQLPATPPPRTSDPTPPEARPPQGHELATVAIVAATIGAAAFLLMSLAAGLHWWGLGLALAAAAAAVAAGLRARGRPRDCADHRALRVSQLVAGAAVIGALATALVASDQQDTTAPEQTALPQVIVPTQPSPAQPGQPAQPTPDPNNPNNQANPANPNNPADPTDPNGPLGGLGGLGGLLLPQPSEQLGVPTQPADPLRPEPTAKGTLDGHVVTSDGSPVAGATVVVTRSSPGDTSNTPECPLTASTTTDASGAYSMQLCQLGEGLGYTAKISAGGKSTSAKLFVNSGRTTTYSVTLDVPPPQRS